MEKKPIKSYQDLELYKRTYKNMVVILKEIVPRLPVEEKYDLADQLRRCCKGIPSLIAEGFAKRYQKRSWHKYLEDTIGEINEIIHHLNVCIDIYAKYLNAAALNELKTSYEIAARQAYKLKEKWIDFHNNRN